MNYVDVRHLLDQLRDYVQTSLSNSQIGPKTSLVVKVEGSEAAEQLEDFFSLTNNVEEINNDEIMESVEADPEFVAIDIKEEEGRLFILQSIVTASSILTY